MCGRFTLRLPPQELQKFFDLIRAVEIRPRYNIAPTQDVPIIRETQAGREANFAHWGLIPHWAKDRKIAARMINARAETLAEKPSFRSPFKKQRCLIPADGFYEWKDEGGKYKQPYLIAIKEEQPLALAGLWSSWDDPETSETIVSCTIITTSANELMQELHHRMPVILSREHWDVWLDLKISDAETLNPLLVPYPAYQMQYRPVSRLVSNARNESPDCLLPPEEKTGDS